MKPIELFEDITDIIAHDYAGAEEFLFPELSERFLSVCSQLDEHFGFEDEQLFNYVQLYLQAVGDPMLAFHIDEYAGFRRSCRGFSARSDGKELYITTARQEAQVRPGDKIATISYQPPEKFRSLALQMLDGVSSLSERDQWDPFLNHARVIEVQREASGLEGVILETYPPEPMAPEFACRKIDTDTAYLKIQSFQESERVDGLLRANHALLTQSSRLILDLRQAGGDNRDAVLSLLPYVCDRDMTVSEFFQDREIYTRHSERNYALSRAQIAPYCDAADAQVSKMAAEMLADLEVKRGQGLLLEVEEEEGDWIKTCRSAEKIILLTDTGCEGEAEWLVLGCSRQANVTRIGRPTRGSIDYRNLVTVDYGFGRTFTYPISKTKGCYEGHGYNKTGVPVDKYIPWRPEEIWEDVVLKQAINL